MYSVNTRFCSIFEIVLALTYSIFHIYFNKSPFCLGIVFRAVAKIPADCKGDQICEMSKNITKDEKKERSFIIQGQITLDGVELRGIYEGQWSLGKNVKIPKVELVLKIGKETKIYFAVTVDIADPKLELGGMQITN